ncbi:MAG: GNAT family N-acetyltransferase, partial [Actinomycetota bacterium]|nr:GNAT family N-acetyltransferase [Actinomycetota bacterium]
GLPSPGFRFFRTAWQELAPKGMLRLLLAEHEHEGRTRLVAGSIFLTGGRTVTYAYNGRRLDSLALQPNYAIQWQAIHDACRDGFRRYDIGEVPEGNASLAEFKSKWGAHAGRIYRYYYPAPRELEAGTFRSGGHPRQVVNSAWRRLPLPVTALLGDSLYRYL